MPPLDPVKLTQDLICCPSVTPAEAGALDVLQGALESIGFACTRLTFEEEGTAPVDNLHARWGEGRPAIAFAGHTDVVPPGDPEAWRFDPFGGVIENDVLYGRGAADMKSGIAAFAAAASRVIAQAPPKGAISLIITGDEEGPAVNGTVKLVSWMRAQGEEIDACIVGEPSSAERLGDGVKIGRRGSLHAQLVATGVQGHSAYPHLADNAATRLIHLLGAIVDEPLDGGTEHFEPSNLAVTNIEIGNRAKNVIPGRAAASINIRFNDLHTGETLRDWLNQRLAAVDSGYSLSTHVSAEPFLTRPGPLTRIVQEAVRAVTGKVPELSTGGGTSDARFVKDLCPVVEVGVVNKSIHKVDEHVALSDITGLTDIYERVLRAFFAAEQPARSAPREAAG